MDITTSRNVPDDTYSRTNEHEPVITATGIQVYDGYGSRRGWGTPGTSSTVVLNDDDFCAVHVGFHHKHGGGQFWRYYTATAEGIQQTTWAKIPDEQRQRILDAADQKAPGWAKTPGKLRSERITPTKTARTAYKLVQVVNDQMVSMYDGETTYTIGKRLAQAAGDNHRGGYYSHPTADQVMALWEQGTLVPEDCYHDGMTVALIECEISGTLITYSNGKIASTYLTPRRIVATFVHDARVAA